VGLTLGSETLPAATQGVAYSQNISAQAHGGFAPYTFSLLSTNSPYSDVWFVSAAGVITGTPNVTNFLITETGVFIVTETGINLSWM
jgi:hypothetical protein